LGTARGTTVEYHQHAAGFNPSADPCLATPGLISGLILGADFGLGGGRFADGLFDCRFWIFLLLMQLRFLPMRSPAEPPTGGELEGKPRPAPATGGGGGKIGDSGRVSPQPSGAVGVPEDMATLAMANPGAPPRSILRVPNPAAVEGERTDAEVMLAVATGDEAGYNYLVTKYHRQIIHFLFRMVHNEAIAEELAQEVFLRVYRSRESYRAEAKFSTWLYRIATNLAVNHARDTKHERTAQTLELDAPDAESGTTPEVADDDPNVEQTMLREERMAAIRAQVAALPERQRMAVLMHKYQEMDYRQIGEVLKLSESATKSLLFRAYQTLRERLKEFV
jgi:RNA polymerase sigma-70 factor, ECF subfamily